MLRKVSLDDAIDSDFNIAINLNFMYNIDN